MKRSVSLIVALSLLSVVGTSEISVAADVLPRAEFPQCSAERNTYCISAVVFVETTGEKPGVWFPTGTPVTDAAGGPTAVVYPTFDKVPYSGRWSYQGFDLSRGHDGVYVSVRPANEFTDSMLIAVEPAGVGLSGKVERVKDESTGRVGSLFPDMTVRVTVRLGTLEPSLTIGVANVADVNRSMDGETSVLTFEGSPVPVPIQAKAADCVGESGVAIAKPYQLYALVVFENGRDPFGIPGLSGDMLVMSNGACRLSTPVWKQDSLSFAWEASAPHFAPDGTTVNRGFYRAFIPTTDAGMLFGLSDPKQAATSLVLEFEDTDFGSVSVERRVAVQKAKLDKVTKEVIRPERIVIAFTNFQYSSPRMTVRVKSSRLNMLKQAQKKLVVKNRAIHKKNKN